MSITPVNPDHMRALSNIKYLYKLGVIQSRKPGPLSGYSLLQFQDAIEWFLGVAAQKVNVIKKTIYFDEYFTIIESELHKPLQHTADAKKLNLARVALKHNNIFPDKYAVKNYLEITNNFFEDNTPLVFGIRFSDISLLQLIRNVSVKEELRLADDQMQVNNHHKALEHIALAFDLLLQEYNNPSNYPHHWSPLQISPFFDLQMISFAQNDHEHQQINALRDKVTAIEKVVAIIALGLNNRDYIKFKVYSPQVIRGANNTRQAYMEGLKDITIDEQTVYFCFQFVLESTLYLQELELDQKNQNP